MLALGHAGIPLGAAALMVSLLPQVASGKAAANAPSAGGSIRDRATFVFARLGDRLDIRLLLFGSLLPDIIDKPVGQVIFREALSSGRIFAHSLLFLLLWALAGLYRYRHGGDTGLLAISYGVLAHLVLDGMWSLPVTLFWPMLGPFERMPLTGWLGNLWYALTHDPAVYLPEIAGGLVLVTFAWVLLRGGSGRAFISKGRLRAG